MNDYEEVSDNDMKDMNDMILPLTCIECKYYNHCYYDDMGESDDEETEV